MMDAKLKAKLVEAIEKAYDGRVARQVKFSGPDGKPECAKNALLLRGNCTLSAQKTRNLIYESVQRKFADRRLWHDIEKALARETFERILAEVLRRLLRSEGGAVQLSLPGFEHLPKRIHLERQRYAFPALSVVQFLKYKDWYECRMGRDQRVVGDLKRLAEKVEPFAKEEPQLTVAEALRRAEPPAMAIVR